MSVCVCVWRGGGCYSEISCCVLAPPHHFVYSHLFLLECFSSSQILPVKNTGEKARGRNGGQQNLSEEKGPLRGPSSLLQNAPRDEDKRSKGKKKSFYSLKIDFCSLTGRQVASNWGRRAGFFSTQKLRIKPFFRMFIFLRRTQSYNHKNCFGMKLCLF